MHQESAGDELHASLISIITNPALIKQLLFVIKVRINFLCKNFAAFLRLTSYCSIKFANSHGRSGAVVSLIRLVNVRWPDAKHPDNLPSTRCIQI